MRRLLTVLLLALTAVGVAGSPAQAHNVLIGSDPKDGATLTASPARVTLVFDPTYASRLNRIECHFRDYKGFVINGLPLHQPRRAPNASRGLHGSLQLRTQAEDPRRPHPIRIHLQNLDSRAGSIHLKSDPPDAGTEHLMCLVSAIDDGAGYGAEHLVA